MGLSVNHTVLLKKNLDKTRVVFKSQEMTNNAGFCTIFTPCRKLTSSRWAGSLSDPACIAFIASYAPVRQIRVGNCGGRVRSISKIQFQFIYSLNHIYGTRDKNKQVYIFIFSRTTGPISTKL